MKAIIFHCSDTPKEMDIGAEEIRRWHTDPKPKGNGWLDIGYHFVIRRNGLIEVGRPVGIDGAHVKGHNIDTIGICMVGGKGGVNFTKEQWSAAEELTKKLKDRYPEAEVKGHRDYDDGKDCPFFDAGAWWG